MLLALLFSEVVPATEQTAGKTGENSAGLLLMNSPLMVLPLVRIIALSAEQADTAKEPNA
jgi:hypothetical protein